MSFAILAARCNECLYGKDKIVSNERRSEILRKIRQRDSYFVCHKASIVGVEAACHGDWEQRGCGQLGRIMDRLGGVVFVAEADLAKLPPSRNAREHDE